MGKKIQKRFLYIGGLSRYGHELIRVYLWQRSKFIKFNFSNDDNYVSFIHTAGEFETIQTYREILDITKIREAMREV